MFVSCLAPLGYLAALAGLILLHLVTFHEQQGPDGFCDAVHAK
jgi:hypothetical protein